MFNLIVVYPESNRVLFTRFGNVLGALQKDSGFIVVSSMHIFDEFAVGLNVLGVFGRARIVGVAGRAIRMPRDVFLPILSYRANQNDLMTTR